jgi:hypothetical protein
MRMQNLRGEENPPEIIEQKLDINVLLINDEFFILKMLKILI